MILVCGDAMLDCYWHGEVTRISPEAPVPVISVKRVEEREGAAANVAKNVKAMGVECRSEFGTSAKQVTKIRAMGKNQQMLRLDFDYPQSPIYSLNYSGCDLVIFVDYGKGTLENVQTLIRDAKKAGLTVLVDPKGYDYERYRGADVVKPNLDEMRAMVGGWKDEEDLFFKVDAIRKKAEIGSILLTRAAGGMSLYTDSDSTHIKAVATSVLDVTGAGETAIAALGVGLHQGLSLEQSSRFANKAAGIVVGRFGPSVATKEEVFG